MKSKQSKRAYTMTTRADQVARNERNILDATVVLWLDLPLHEITLEQVAEKAGVTVRTILRKYGSKEGLIEACMEDDSDKFETLRNETQPGNILEILHVLLSEYETMGNAIIRTIAVEAQYPVARKILETGRSQHRQWCARVFEPFLPDAQSEAYEMKLTAFIAATEIYLWKLLRKDLGKSYAQTMQVFKMLIEGLITK